LGIFLLYDLGGEWRLHEEGARFTRKGMICVCACGGGITRLEEITGILKLVDRETAIPMG
jgi:hypothetical protein